MQHALPHLGNPAGPGVGSSGAAATAAAAAAAAAAACWLPPADVILTVGGRPFAAHRAVLSAHSGYLKALLVASDASVPPPTPTISVPNVSPESFAPLLAFMYSGFLDLGPDNIYGVLLAAHLLHMPRALAFCRAFLLHQQQRRTALAAALASTGHHLPPPPPPPPTPPTPILKPIPSRKILPVLVPPRWPPTHRPTPHSPPHLMHTSEASPFRAVISTSSSSVSQGLSSLPPPLPPPIPPPILHVPFHPERPYSPPNHHADPGPSNRTPSSLSPCPSSMPSSNSPSPITSSPSLSMASNSRTPPPTSQPHQTLPPCSSSSKAPSTSGRAGTSAKGGEASASVPSSSSSTTSSTNSTAGPKVVLDVACCDGPVRFHRVLNDNYDLELGQLLGESADDVGEGGAETLTVVGSKRPVLMGPADKGPVERPSMGQDVGDAAGAVEGASRDDSSSVDVDSISSDASKSRASTANTTSEPLYRCLYCNHTFKSHYCYQKHTRRHINPVALELGTAGAPGCGVAGKLKTQVVVKEVKLLDMNVQYYPCKTCGSKFPSYYFVHKHRKMCHAGEIGEGGVQPQPQQHPPHEGSSEGRDREVAVTSEGGRVEGGGGDPSERKFAPLSEASSSGTDCQPKADFSPVFKSESGGGKW